MGTEEEKFHKERCYLKNSYLICLNIPHPRGFTKQYIGQPYEANAYFAKCVTESKI